ncbi:MAG: SMP-30/gluconolactonase/LRE family protein [Pirellulales bacterium]|nr:SMP-30/gluconolactonase/LRE family protein [Pirellulales bacterium]
MGVAPRPVGKIERLDPQLDQIIRPDAQVELIAEGFAWSEGPVWWREGRRLLFSDIPRNTVFEWSEEGGLKEFLIPSGYTGGGPRQGALHGKQPPAEVDEQGSNGLAIDDEGRLVLCQHGDRRVARLAQRLRPDRRPEAKFETVADRWEGKRFNSPNDLAIHPSGAIYFTDPPYGLEKGGDTSARDIDFNGVYRAAPDGSVTLVTRAMTKPNGIAFTPDFKTLVVGQSDNEAPVWRAFEVQQDGSLGEPRVLFDAAHLVERGLAGSPDGFKFDQRGNLLTTGPGGVLVISPEGQHLGTISTGQLVANCAFGDDGSTLYMTSNMTLCRVKLKTRGAGF